MGFLRTIKWRSYNSGETDQTQIRIYDPSGDNYIEWRDAANDLHDYTSVVGNLSHRQVDYFPISRRWLQQAPGGYTWREPGWSDYTMIHTSDDWYAIYINDSAIPNSYAHFPGYTNPATLVLQANSHLGLDDFQIYKDKYIYPQTEIRYGTYPLYWYGDVSGDNYLPASGIIAYGSGLTLKQIATAINNVSLISYDDSTKTATLKTNLFLKAGTDFTMRGETLLVDTSSGQKIITTKPDVKISIRNSTVSATTKNPVIFNPASTISFNLNNPERLMPLAPVSSSVFNEYCFTNNGRFVCENSTLNNIINLFFEGAQEIRINDTVFSNMSMSNFGYNTQTDIRTYYGQHQSDYIGSKGLWITPRLDLANYSVNNISFVNPNGALTMKVAGGQWIQNDTVVKNSDLSNIKLAAKKIYKYNDYDYFNQPYENTTFSLLNCKFNELNLTVETDRARIKSKYYTEVLVKDSSGNPIQNAVITITPSDSRYPAEKLYETLRPPDDAEYGWYISPGGDGGVNGAKFDPSVNGWDIYQGGDYFRWFNAQPLNSATTGSIGRTALPSEDVNNSIVLTGKVFTNETGTQQTEQLTYSMTISAAGYQPSTVTGITPDQTWYTNSISNPHQIVVTLSSGNNPPASPPVANFNTNTTRGTVPLAVVFTDTSTGSPTKWNWNFGDGNTSTEQNPTHTYSTAGTYTANLTASNANGTNSKLATITVLEPPTSSPGPVLPVADFNSNVTTGNVPLSVKFTDLSKNATGWNWNFGDGNTSTEQNPTHTYFAVGTYTVNLIVGNANGTNSKLATINVAPPVPTTPNPIPVATFSASPTSGVAPLNVVFTDKSTNSPTAWNWNFGDGTANSTAKNPTHTYSKAGSFTVVLTASNSAGSSTLTESKFITVMTKPVAAFSGSPTSGKASLKVQFTDKSTGSPTSWSWNFGDGSTSTVKSPAHTYTKKGRFSVTLTVKNAVGSNTVKKTYYITVK